MNEWSYTIITVLYGDYENILTEYFYKVRGNLSKNKLKEDKYLIN